MALHVPNLDGCRHSPEAADADDGQDVADLRPPGRGASGDVGLPPPLCLDPQPGWVVRDSPALLDQLAGRA